jgi:hypothetical protein
MKGRLSVAARFGAVACWVRNWRASRYVGFAGGARAHLPGEIGWGNGFRFMFGKFCHVAYDKEANEEGVWLYPEEDRADRERSGKGEETDAAWLLCEVAVVWSGVFWPRERGYSDLRETPISEMAEKGIRTSDGKEHELDVIILAAGCNLKCLSLAWGSFGVKEKAVLERQTILATRKSADNSYASRTAAEVVNIAANPLNGEMLVEETWVWRWKGGMLWKPKMSSR